MIAPFQEDSGVQNDVRPWLIPDQAFAQLINAYVFRGRVRKRFGSYLMNGEVNSDVAQLYSRLRIDIGVTPGPLPVPDANGLVSQLQIGQMFSVGDDMFTVYQLGADVLTYSTNPSATATINSTTTPNTVTFSGEAAMQSVYFYPSLPVMGLVSYDTSLLNDEPVYAFDTQFAYQFTGTGGGGWERLGTATWSGADYEFFWGSTYRGPFNSDAFLFVTNFHAPDRQKYWDGANWNQLSPILNGSFRLLTSRIIVPFKDRLICLNTIENNEGTQVTSSTMYPGTAPVTGDFTGIITGFPVTSVNDQKFLVGTTVYSVLSVAAGAQALGVEVINTRVTPPTATFDAATGEIIITGNNNNPNQIVYWLPNTGGTTAAYVNRCRFSQNGSPVSSNGWVDTIGGKGGYIDAPTKEQIITCDFLKDRLIVYFERSTWELAYTNNQILPFVWQQINTELGAESTFSVVPFDKIVLGVGNVGIHACNGNNVDRIDQKIPDTVFAISNDNEGVYRVYGIRDYFNEMVYWSFPYNFNSQKYPNRVLVFNYKTGTWAFNDDSITAFGYYQRQSGVTWAGSGGTWEQSVEPWDSGALQSQFKQIIAGNQQGFVFIVSTQENSTRNAPALQITNMAASGILITLNVVDHNLLQDDFVCIESCQGITGLNGMIFKIYDVIDANNFRIASTLTGTYTGGGTVARVSRIDILTKQYNFYVNQDYNAYVSKVDFYVDKTTTGQITVDSYVSASDVSLLEDGTETGSLIGSGVLETSPYDLVPLESSQSRLWHPLYLQADGECIQLRLYLNDDQMTTNNIAWSDFEMHAMTFFVTRTASRLS